jgi:hypothetical protein
MFNFFRSNQGVAEKLYQQNAELTIKNKTLSLLDKLYQTSILALNPEEMGAKITAIIKDELNLEAAGILIFDKTNDLMKPIAFFPLRAFGESFGENGFFK